MNFLDIEDLVSHEVRYKMISSAHLLGDRTWFLQMSSKPSKDALYMTCNNAGSKVLCRKHIFIVIHLLRRAIITFWQYTFLYQLLLQLQRLNYISV